MKHKNLPLALAAFIIAFIAFVNIPANAGTTNGSNKQFFIENKGQWPDEVLYLASIAGMNAWITNNGVVYDHFIIERNYEPSGLLSLPVHERRMAEMENTTIRGHVVKMNLEGTGRNAASAGIDKKPGYYNYFKGNDSDKWASYVPLYGQIEIHEVYEGINVKYYFDGGWLRYDFHVQAGADINQIRFSLEGQEALNINENGELIIETSLGEVTHGQLYAYQFINGAEKEVACHFLKNSDGTLGIVAEYYDPAKELVIDPLVFSTYLGGNDLDAYPSIALTQDGSIVVAGQTNSANFPVTAGAYQTGKNGDFDICISKLDHTGSMLIFSSFLGGNQREEHPKVVLGEDESIFITGSTQSSDFPVTNQAFQTNNPGGSSAFVTRMNASGTSLFSSTYLGGNGNDYGIAIAVDQTGNVYVTGGSLSYSGFPTTPGTIHYQWGTLFVAKLNPTGTGLVYSAIFAEAESHAIAIDAFGNAFVTGTIGNGYFPITPNAFQSVPSQYSWSAFALVLNPTASAVLHSTYLKGSHTDFGRTIKIASNGDIVVGGYTWSNDFPTSAGSFQPVGNGNDAFIIRLNSSCTQMVWGTVLSGNGTEQLFGMELDDNDNVIVTGHTGSYDFPVTTDQFIGNDGFYEAVYVSKLSNNGSELLYSALLSNDSYTTVSGRDVKVDADNYIIVAGITGPGYHITNGAYQQIFGGGYWDMFITSIMPVNCQTVCNVSVINHVSCNGGVDAQAQSNPAGGIPPYTYVWSNGQTGAIAVNLAAGTYTVIVTDSIGCTATESIVIEEPLLLVFDTIITNPANCFNSADGLATAIVSGGTPPYSFEWSNGEYGTSAHNLEVGVHFAVVTDNNGCIDSISFTIGHIPSSVPEILDIQPTSCIDSQDGSAIVACTGGTPPYGFSWSNGETGDTAIALAVGDHFVIVTDANGCEETINFSIGHIPAPVPEIISTQPASCANSLDGVAIAKGSEGTPPYTFAWSNGETGETATTLPVGENTVTIIDSNGCEETISFSIDYIRPYDMEEICAVTVNPETGGNTILWQKTGNVRTIAYNIYRETSASGVYELMGSTLFSDPSVFNDTLANTAQQSYRYKLAVVDSCQEESALSLLHKTIHLSMSVGINNDINLLWTAYEGFTYPTHYIMRSVDNGTFNQIGLVPSTHLSFTDISPPTGIKKYRIEVDMPAGCGLLKDGSRIKSNTVIHEPSGIGNLAGKVGFMIYPNPGDGFFTLIFQTPVYEADLTITVIDRLGSILHTQEITAGSLEVKLNLQHLPGGIYYLRVAGSNISGSVKVVKL